MRPSNAVRTVWDAEAIDTSHIGFRLIQKIATIHASSGFIRGIPTKATSRRIIVAQNRQTGPLLDSQALILVLNQYNCIGCSPGRHPDTQTMASAQSG